jgi:hypothetical protein
MLALYGLRNVEMWASRWQVKIRGGGMGAPIGTSVSPPDSPLRWEHVTRSTSLGASTDCIP